MHEANENYKIQLTQQLFEYQEVNYYIYFKHKIELFKTKLKGILI